MNKFNKTLGNSFTTPKIEKLSKIKPFLENLSSEEPIFLEVQKLKDIRSKKLECFFNVELFEKQGQNNISHIKTVLLSIVIKLIALINKISTLPRSSTWRLIHV